MSEAPVPSLHGTAVAIGGAAVLITGVAGTGKTTLALELIRRARAGRHHAGLIADDRVFVETRDGSPVLICPPQIAGKLEVRGYGVIDASDIAADAAPLALVAELVPADRAVRFAQDETVTIAGRTLPCLRLPAGPAPSAANAVFAALGLPAWL